MSAVTSKMYFQKDYKYLLVKDSVFQTSILGFDIDRPMIRLTPTGKLTLRAGYAFDGPSGPVTDRKTNMSASGLHDGLYELMRKGYIPHIYWRHADCEYAKQLRKCGAWEITIKVNLAGLALVKGKYALPENRKKVYEVRS